MNKLGQFNDPFTGGDPNAVLNCRVFGFVDITDSLSHSAWFSDKMKGLPTNTQGYDKMVPTSSPFAVGAVANMSFPNSYYAACVATNPLTARLQGEQGFDSDLSDS